jgi:hypothetical protein
MAKKAKVALSIEIILCFMYFVVVFPIAPGAQWTLSQRIDHSGA